MCHANPPVAAAHPSPSPAAVSPAWFPSPWSSGRTHSVTEPLLCWSGREGGENHLKHCPCLCPCSCTCLPACSPNASAPITPPGPEIEAAVCVAVVVEAEIGCEGCAKEGAWGTMGGACESWLAECVWRKCFSSALSLFFKAPMTVLLDEPLDTPVR